MVRMTDKLRMLLVVLGLAVLAPVGALAEGETTAVERLNKALLSTMQNGQELGFQGRYDALQPTLNETFDFPTMTRVSLGRHWSEMSEAEHNAVVDAFTRMSVSTFAARFDDFSGEHFSIAGTKPGPQNLVLVTSLLHRQNDKPVELTYVVRQTDAGPRIIDVLAEGRYSELARQRAELSSIFSKSGAEGLVQSLNAKAASLAETG